MLHSNRKRRVWRPSRKLSGTDLEMLYSESPQAKSPLLTSLVGQSSNENVYSNVYFAYLKSKIRQHDEGELHGGKSFASILTLPAPCEPSTYLNEVFDLIYRFATQISCRDSQRSNLEGICESVIGLKGVSLKDLDPEAKQNTLQGFFAITGWLTMLFEPANTIEPGLFAMISLGGSEPTISTRNMSAAKKSIPLLLSDLGQRLPQLLPEDSSVALQTGSLSIYALTKLGKVNIAWSNSLGSHLDFDVANRPTLTLFRLPSFCAMYCVSHDECGLLSWMLSGYLSQRTVSVQRLMQEIILSYRLLFGQSRQTRGVYSKRERSEAQAKDNPDPLLDLLCGEPHGKKIRDLSPKLWPLTCLDGYGDEASLLEQSVYNTKTDFPIFGMRLKTLADFSPRQRPNKARDLWRDKRDPLQWYTFWAVIFSILLSAFQVAIGAAQLAVAVSSSSAPASATADV